MNKASLMQTVKKATNLSYRETAACIDVVIDTLADALSQGERIELRGFGSFFVKQVASKKHPGIFSENKLIPAHGKIVFRPCRRLRESVWGKSSKELEKGD